MIKKRLITLIVDDSANIKRIISAAMILIAILITDLSEITKNQTQLIQIILILTSYNLVISLFESLRKYKKITPVKSADYKKDNK
ncbi:MAG: hypothetical protein GQ477_04060 [Nanohaloarchaea archaeon]|nr:hypothetical protein [Candidatus Nanohaloarchaea archaeon]